MRPEIKVVVTVFCLALIDHTSAFAEVQPDLTLSSVPVIVPGADLMTGDLSDGLQDLRLFTVTQEGPPSLYAAQLSGLSDTGGALGIIQITRDDSGQVTRRDDVAIAGLQPLGLGQVGQVSLGPLLLPEGEYILGVTPLIIGQGDYTLTLSATQAQPLPADAVDLPFGLWTGTAAQTRCLTLPQQALDLAVFGVSEGNLTLWLEGADGTEHLRARPKEGWQVSAVDGAAHRLCIEGRDVASWLARVAATESPDVAAEPDDGLEQAHVLQVGSAGQGLIDPRGSARDADVFRLAGSMTGRRLTLSAVDGRGLRYTLATLDGATVKSDILRGMLEIGPIGTPEDLILTLQAEPGATYSYAYDEDFLPSVGDETEPNDTLAMATLWPPERVAHGVLTAGDTDMFSLEVTEAPQLWRLQADGQQVRRLTVFDPAGAQIIQRRIDRGGILRISQLYLIPGSYHVAVEGDGPYSLRLLPQGPRRDDVEFEPNEDGQVLTVGQPLRGQLDAGDKDSYRFTAHAQEWLTLRITPPLGETIAVYLKTGNGGEIFRRSLTGGRDSFTYTRDYPAGDYAIEIFNRDGVAALDDYVLALEPAALPFGPVKDREPNDYAHAAESWPADGRLAGTVGVVEQDVDVYRLDAVASGSDLRVCDPPDGIDLMVTDASGARVRSRNEDTDTGRCQVHDLIVDGTYFIELSQGSGAARTGQPTAYDFSPTGTGVPEITAGTMRQKLAVSLISAPPAPAAFMEGFAQNLPLALAVNASDITGPLALSLQASEAGWSVGLPQIVETGDGGAEVQATVTAPPDLDERPVRLHLRLTTAQQEGTVSFDLTPTPGLAPVGAMRSYPVPVALRGGLDMAQARFGARILSLDGIDLEGRDPPDVNNADDLIDGLAEAGNGFVFGDTGGQARFNFALAGETPVPLAGLLLTPRDAPGAIRSLRDFRIEASEDGITFSEVLRDTLQATQVEQAFVFDNTVNARALRLIAETNWAQGNNNTAPIRLGTFKAVATPGWMAGGEESLNIADPILGGQVVWSDPPGMISRDWDQDILSGGDKNASLIRNTARMQLVIGFHHTRAAQIAAIDWVMDTANLQANNAAPVTDLTLFASVDSPIGPWTEVARWAPPQDALPDAPARLNLPEPVWARYLRFDMTATEAAEYLRLPERLRVWEAPGTAAIPSILGEWGEFSQAAAFESLTNIDPPRITPSIGGATADAAVPLAENTQVTSAVQRGQREDWWLIPSGPRPAELQLTLDTGNAGGAITRLFAADGTESALRRASTAEAEARGLQEPLFLGRVDADGPILLHVVEPLRPILISYDTSGSTAPYREAIDRALGDIALRADPDRDLIGFLPFGTDLLGRGLLGDPELLIRQLGRNSDEGDSSNAEAALMQAADILAQQEGVRGIILITDAATNRDAGLWSVLSAVRPRIAALAIPSTGAFGPDPERERDLMENWGRAAGGFYQYVSTQADFTSGFARAVDRMRGPKTYHMRLTFGPVQPEPDGSLRVLAAVTPDAPQDASRLIVLLDTSGSMLQRLGGKPRYQIAQDALMELADAADAAQVAVGLRRFGIAPEACDTTLLASVESDGGGALRAVVADIVPQNNARTPIALALTAAAADLGQGNGARRIVLLTDGEETCGGDPEAAIAALVDQGISTRVDIIGLAIDDLALSASFSDWAARGNGRYVNASDDDLAQALLATIRRQYRIIAADGTSFEGEVDGAPLTLPPGRYSLAVDGMPAPIEVQIDPAAERIVELD